MYLYILYTCCDCEYLNCLKGVVLAFLNIHLNLSLFHKCMFLVCNRTQLTHVIHNYIFPWKIQIQHLWSCFLIGNSLIQYNIYNMIYIIRSATLKNSTCQTNKKRTSFPELSAAQFPYLMLRY